ncbi:RcpC/CpaB family pilus assembly protein [Streptomyces cyaneofuscatus]|uniref:RcpC/CpaB family pilus assembly protein n=1 Tax=Streptomyces cyaneofuscatus TaxID=66883 RepID=UPI0036A1DEEF
MPPSPFHARPPAPPPSPCGVGPFAPLRVRGGGAYRLRRMLRRQRRAIAAGIALAGAALATTGLGGAASGTAASGSAASDSAAVSGTAVSGTAASDTATGSGRPSARLVSAPVRIADAATVRLLRPGDHVDVIAVGEAGDDARLVARGVRVAQVPGRVADDGGHRGGGGEVIGTGAAPEGALVMLSVERSTATALLGAGASGRLALAVSDGN